MQGNVPLLGLKPEPGSALFIGGYPSIVMKRSMIAPFVEAKIASPVVTWSEKRVVYSR